MQTAPQSLCMASNRVVGTDLDLAFRTKALRALCEDASVAISELGKQAADKLTQRLAELDAAASVDDLIVGSPRKLIHNGLEIVALKLTGTKQIRICANHVPPRVTEDGRVDWSRVRRVKVVAVGEP